MKTKQNKIRGYSDISTDIAFVFELLARYSAYTSGDPCCVLQGTEDTFLKFLIGGSAVFVVGPYFLNLRQAITLNRKWQKSDDQMFTFNRDYFVNYGPFFAALVAFSGGIVI